MVSGVICGMFQFYVNEKFYYCDKYEFMAICTFWFMFIAKKVLGILHHNKQKLRFDFDSINHAIIHVIYNDQTILR